MGSPTASAHVLHAAIAPAEALVDERRTLYRLAVRLFTQGSGLSDNLLDHPIVRYEIGRALAGKGELDLDLLRRVATVRVRDAGLPLVADPRTAELIEAPLRIVAPPGASPRPLTEDDGDRFEAAAQLVADGVGLLRKLAPETAEDLLAHVSMVTVLAKETSGGVISASSRYVPGIVLINEPSTPMEVAEALVHEGAHEKFFDLAITRQFLDAHAEDAEFFENSWSHARWPLEQTFAAWHAYSCLAQFALVAGDEPAGPLSLLPKARERADEIGRWLLAHTGDLQPDARWLLGALTGVPAAEPVKADRGRPMEHHVSFRVLDDVRFDVAGTGRAVAARPGRPPEIFWLDSDASWLLARLDDESPLSFGRLLSAAVPVWGADSGVPGRLTVALHFLMAASLVEPAA
ncbi:HEXXH motif-containing protein [Lentzea fradiae]|uniref:HEXXH motif-containing protein n=1 Tax=Lentzea fradiae TaxID=200378 RepID=A0A1G7SLD2_9PSEU|nr:HEXXH motif-containing putative peptide modification protein [Lentzea fradiae]SDG23875.1 HEXXH motif-containing protein [Lentzea fradiae]